MPFIDACDSVLALDDFARQHNLEEDDLTAKLRAAAESRTKQWMSSFFRGNERHFSETQIDREFLGPLLSSF